ncbi:amastin-like protein [Strigomonas culicis]|uniref:Amastin-like protein n=1 Tax=Strigomonas culicis TaxID=28005 RepID=S9WGD5_9TRYP|nr:amastin-like protein [Strigomonas culicis]EPY34800.1 amastin-like protein [Strigomonas culicis]|eukprot:EPY27843.1 amastin-like protein [Strigomonas culicis]
MGCIANLVYGVLQAAALACFVVATPLDQFRSKSEEKEAVNVSSYFGNTYCLTYWGVKDKCYSMTYNGRPWDIFENCNGRVERFRTAEVCAIGAIVVVAASLVLFAVSSCFSCCCPCCKYILMLLNLATTVLSAVAWGCMLDCYRRSMGDSTVTTTTSTATPIAARMAETLVFESVGSNGVYSLTANQCMKLQDYTGTDGTLQYGMRLGAGWVLTIIGWAVVLVNMFIVLLPI